ncbi:hypothetical protein BT96DRAFT_922288 [Gymnopus androsaceus JB14]|uniref:Uncharacterized protein n=1 Tax=Gymnopus androsaceus JB14 TaxID=1447944 RepID=A0A6A4HH52_9AGAR|nr:hypothetical protein BT96DRAFT_922288 [Gymnopus androsaceus JB14]
MVAVPPGEPKTSPKPQPIGSIPLIILFTTCTCCVLFLLWRRADAFRAAISHQLKTITRSNGQIRLSEDDGPPSHEFLEDDGEDALELDTDDVRALSRQSSPSAIPTELRNHESQPDETAHS